MTRIPDHINVCLNCVMPRCNGQYPHCGVKEYTGKEETHIKDLPRGGGMVLVALLVKLGKTRPEIVRICDSTYSGIGTLLKSAVRAGWLTQDEADAAKAYGRAQ